MNEWYKEWFASEEYLKVYQHRDKSDSKKLSDLILETISIDKNALILDAGCGAGRHAVYFAAKGFNVIGFDLSMPLLLIARSEARRENISVHLIQADFRKIFFKKNFDLILNLFTSFGYFQTDEENFSFLRTSYYYLKEDGYYVLDYFNKKYLEKNLVPKSQILVQGFYITEKRNIVNDRIVKKIIIEKKDRTKVFTESVKLYDKSFIIDKLKEYGYKVVKIFGDYDGSDYNEASSPRLLIIAKR